MSTHRAIQAVVIGGARDTGPILQDARAIGALLGRLNITLITGGGTGVMEAANRGCQEVGGTTVSIIQSAEHADANLWSSIVIPTGLGHGRNVVTALAGDFIIALGGGAGTLSEMSFGCIHGKPIFALTTHGGCSKDSVHLDFDNHQGMQIVYCKTMPELERAIRNFAS